MSANFLEVTSVEALDRLLEESKSHPVALLKHSNTCGISADIHDQVSSVDGDINVVVVQEHRDVSNAVAERLGVRHASPQAFVLVNGEPVYHATHYGIDPKKIEEKLLTK